MRLVSLLVSFGFIFGPSVSGEEWLTWEPFPPNPYEVGLAGPFTGVHENHLVVAGGANFAPPVWENDKVWHTKMFVLPLGDSDLAWREAGELERPLGYGTTISLPAPLAITMALSSPAHAG